jgi:hypothetical protein
MDVYFSAMCKLGISARMLAGLFSATWDARLRSGGGISLKHRAFFCPFLHSKYFNSRG